MIVACPTRPHRRQPVFAPAELLLIVLGLAVFILAAAEAAGVQDRVGGCRVLSKGPQVELCSPLFVFRLDTAAGLRAASGKIVLPAACSIWARDRSSKPILACRTGPC